MNTVVEVIIAAILVFFLIAGIRRGLIRQILEIAGIIAAFVAAFYAAHHLAAYLERKIEITYNLALIISAMAIFVGILVAFHLAGIILQKMVNITPLGHVDRLGGGLFGLLKGTLLVSLLLVIVLNLPFPSQFREDLEKDPVVRVIYPVMPMLFDFVLSRTPEHVSFDKVVRSADYSLEDAKKKAEEMEKKIGKNIKKGMKKVQASSGKP